MEPKYILFDMDGVLIDSRRSIIEATEYTLSQFGRSLCEEDAAKIIGPPLSVIYGEIFGFDSETAKLAVSCYKQYYDEHALPLIGLFPDVTEMLQVLHAHGKKLMVATARYTPVTEKILERFDLRQYFCFVAGIDSPVLTEDRNPDKSDVIRCCLTENGILDRECAVMVGDRAEDIRGARRNGLYTIGASYGFGTEEELSIEGADFLAADPLAISRHIIEDFE